MSWPMIPLSDLWSEPFRNGCHQKDMEYGSGEKIVRMVDLYRGNIINTESLDLVTYPKNVSDDYLLQTNDILFNRTSLKIEGVGKASLVPELNDKCFFDCSIIRFRPNWKKVDSRYLIHVLNHQIFRIQMMGITKTATITTISQPDLASLKIPLPPIDEQRRIAAILDKADEVERETARIQEMRAEIIQATFLDMFGDPVTNPKGWETVTIENLVNKDKHAIKRGPFGGSLKKDIFVQEGYLVYEQYHALNNDFTMARYYIDENKFEELKSFEVKSGDIIISCSGVNLGRLAIVPAGSKKGIINQALLKISLDSSKMSTTFFKRVFSDKNFKLKFFGHNRGSGVPNFPPMSTFKKFKFISPPIELQNQFADIVHQINDLDLSALETQATTLKQSLTQELLA